jgi:hypothetical protein
MAATPVTISPNAASSDATMQQIPVTAFDQATFALLQNPNVLDQMFWAGFQVGALPRDMISGVVAGRIDGTAAGLPVQSAADASFPALWPDGNSYNEATLDFGINAKASHLGVKQYPAGGSGSFYCVFMPDSTAASSCLFTQAGTPLAVSVELTSQYLNLWAVYGSTPIGRIQLARSAVIKENSPNILVACWDIATHQLVLYINSKTPYTSPSPAGTGSWSTTAVNLAFFNVASGADPCEVRATRWGVCNVSIHHDPKSQTKLLAMIQAAADTFGIALS